MATKSVESSKSSDPVRDDDSDTPIDAEGHLVKKMTDKAIERRTITSEEFNSVLPPDKASSEEIESTRAYLDEKGVQFVESDDDAEDRDSDKGEGSNTAEAPVPAAEVERTDDPVRMYLREMGSIELLSREGEIYIAKRIESGRNTMIGGICESPLTMRAIVDWRDDLKNERVLLREIIDLESSHQASLGPKSNFSTNPRTEDSAIKQKTNNDSKQNTGIGQEISNDEDEDDEEVGTVPLATMELQLISGVLKSFDKIKSTYNKIRRLQEASLEAVRQNSELSPAQQRRYVKLKNELVELMQGVKLNNQKIEELMDQLYGLSRRIRSGEGRLLRLSQKHKIKRDNFIERYKGKELDPKWISRVRRSKEKGWADFIKEDEMRLDQFVLSLLKQLMKLVLMCKRLSVL